ncbi:hypothetical protein EGW08_009191 [Elysia chlorotica]|uniref:Uncharacterized protein n=1 Tax=Elysia chlorotica TaxID=188477 RepID=A0A3S1BGE7_ELYCH|nr:hypothetical protein EGW08_009191 [Elysia chlorotica]
MSLDLAELVSVTDNVVRSLEKSQSSAGSGSIGEFRFDNNSDSQQNVRPASESEAQDAHSHGIDSCVGTSSALLLAKHPKQFIPSEDDDYKRNQALEDDGTNRLGNENTGNEDSNLDKSKDHSTANQQETTTSDNFFGSSQGSRLSARELKTTSDNLDCTHKAIHVNVTSCRANKNKREEVHRENFRDNSDMYKDPEIIDVPEKIIAIRSGMSSASDEESICNEIYTVLEANRPQDSSKQLFGIKSFGKTVNAHGGGLKQGALSKGILDPMDTAQHGDVYISQFGLTERQRGIKEALAKRADNSHPKKKVVQPRIISQKQSDVDSDLDSARSKHRQLGQSANSDYTLTAAVAASAAVAANQPFLKAQHELEQRMQDFLSHLSELQGREPLSMSNKTASAPETAKRIEDLERQVAELNERRMEHMENLQQQQMQMQAQLLFMSRSRSQPRKPVSYIPQAVASGSNNHQSAATRPSKNIGSSDLPLVPASASYFDINNKASGNFGLRSGQSGQSLFNPETLSSHFNYLNEVRELQGSHLDTPAPREKVPKPTPYSLPQPHAQKSLGFLEELLAQKEDPDRDTTFSVMGGHSPPTKLQKDSNNNSGFRRSDKSPVDTARQLVTSLSELEKETAHSVWNSKNTDRKSKMSERDLSPSPLERYLKHYEADVPDTYERPEPSSAVKRRARKHQAHLAQLGEARAVLQHLEATRATLEGNLESVLRSRRDVTVFSAMMAAAPDSNKEQLRIQRMVNKKISALEADVQREVLKGLAQEQAQQLASKREQERQKLASKREAPLGKATASTLPFQNIDYTAKNKFSISTRQSEQSARLAYGKLNQNFNANPGRNQANTKGKENNASKVKPPPKPTVIRDEKTMVRTYGKPEYQRGRTTIRDPYMHFQNTKRGVASKTSVLNESTVSREGRSRSPPKSGAGYSQMGNQSARQFFFSPTRGYIPLDQGDSAPIQGQLISMAIPLGEPRMDRGMRSAAGPLTLSPDRRKSNPVTSTPVPVTSTGNVAVVSFPVAEEESKEREPELSKQVLPPIDIDSISPSSSRRSDIQIRSPQHGNVNLTFLQNTREGADEEDEGQSDLDYSTTDGDPDLEQCGQGLQFPGYEARPQAEYSGPSFPPQQAGAGGGDWMAGGSQAPSRQTQLSDVIAEDLRRRDLLERNAVYWLEQELMAQVLSKVMPLEVAHKQSDASKDTSSILGEDDSKASPRDDSLMVADMIGQGGLQLFIDAGQPVDSGLIQALVREVLQEKVGTMLAQGQGETQAQRQGEETREEEETAMHPVGQPRVPTPQPTPKTSPLASPRRQQTETMRNRPVTPPLSPPIEGFRFKPVEEKPQELPTEPPPIPPREGREPKPETSQQQQQQQEQKSPQLVAQQLQFVDIADIESEPSVSIDISEELRRVANQGKPLEQEDVVISRHSVATPPISPPPPLKEDTDLVRRQVTPPPTPSLEQMSPAVKPTAHQRTPRQEVQEEEEEEEEEEEQPQPIMISVAVGEDHPLSAGVRTPPRTPSPKRPRTPVSVATEPSPPPSTESSMSETVNENVSEGQWLLSRSEGQVVAGLHINEAVRQQMLKKSAMNRGGDVSTASTLRDTDDLDLDEADPANKSEGEFLYSGLPAPDQDPMLQLLAEMQRNPSMMVPQRDIPAPQVRQILSGPAPKDFRSSTGRSLGELSMGQVPPTQLVQVQARDNREDAQQQHRDRRTKRGGSGQRRSASRSPAQSPNRSLDSNLDDSHRERRSSDRMEGDHRRERGSRTSSPPQNQQRVESGRRGSPQRNHSPPAQQLLSSGSTRGRSSRGQVQYQPVLSEGAPLPTRGRVSAGFRGGARRSSDSRLSRSSDRPTMHRSGSSYMTESVSRSADSVSLRRSGENNTGVLTSSFKSRQSSTGAKKSVDFDLTGTHEGRHWQDERDRESSRGTGQLRDSGGSRDRYSPSRLSASSDQNRSRSLGLTYSFDESLDDSELRRIVGSTGGTDTGPQRMFVTIPSTAGDEESELSEIDISDRQYR